MSQSAIPQFVDDVSTLDGKSGLSAQGLRQGAGGGHDNFLKLSTCITETD